MRIERVRPLGDTPSVVSVVVPCYNYGHYLPDAVGSVLSQGVPVEIIIVDDCSTDDSAEVASELAEQHPQVRLVRNERNLGHIATFNRGLAMVTGEYVVLLSADDMLAPGSLRRAVSLFERNPSVGLVYGHPQLFTDELPQPWNTGTCIIWRGSKWLGIIARRGENLMFSPEAILRASLMRKLGEYDPRAPQTSDMLIWMRAARHADIGRVNGVQAFYRTHPDQMHSTLFAGVRTDMSARADLFQQFFGPGGEGSGDPSASLRLRRALRAIANEATRHATLAIRPDDQSEAAGYAHFASTVDTGITGTWRWRRYERLLRRRKPGITTYLSCRLRWKLKFWTWRALGV